MAMVQDKSKKLTQFIQKTSKNESLRKELIQNPKKSFEKEGIHLPENVEIKVWENNNKTLHLVIPEEKLSPEHNQSNLASNANLTQVCRFIVTQVQENSPLKSKLLANPLAVLQQKKIELPKGLELKIHQNTPNLKNLVLPNAQQGSNDQESNPTPINGTQSIASICNYK